VKDRLDEVWATFCPPQAGRSVVPHAEMVTMDAEDVVLNNELLGPRG
jgi:hypothetical protein